MGKKEKVTTLQQVLLAIPVVLCVIMVILTIYHAVITSNWTKYVPNRKRLRYLKKITVGCLVLTTIINAIFTFEMYRANSKPKHKGLVVTVLTVFFGLWMFHKYGQYIWTIWIVIILKYWYWGAIKFAYKL